MNKSLQVRRPLPPSLFDMPLLSDNFVEQMFKDFFEEGCSRSSFGFGNTGIPYDVAVQKDERGNVTSTELTFAMAGYGKEDIKVDLDDKTLVVSVEKKEEEKKEEGKSFLYRGIRKSAFQTSFAMADFVDKHNIACKFENGLLKITIPSLKSAIPDKPRRIEIAEGKPEEKKD